MKFQLHKRTKTIGLAPDDVVFIGEQKMEKVRTSLITYRKDYCLEIGMPQPEDVNLTDEDGNNYWLNVEGVHDVNFLNALGNKVDIHPLVLSDIANTEHTPKIEIFDKMIFIILKIIHHDESFTDISAEQVSLILGNQYVITFVEKSSQIFNFIKYRITGNQKNIVSMPSDFLVYSIIDAVIDSYYPVLEEIGEKIEDLEDELITKQPSPQTLETIHKLKRSLIYIRRAIWPLRDMIRRMEIDENQLIDDSTKIYLKDLFDHIVQILETLDAQRELVAEILDIYLNSLSIKTNEVMKVLTIIATLFIPMTFITGVYGMNFRNMPEYNWAGSYPAVWTFMLVCGIGMILYFKKRKWI